MGCAAWLPAAASGRCSSAPRAQATPQLGWPQLIAVTDLVSALAAVEEIIERGEGCAGDWRTAHCGRFLTMWQDYHDLRQRDPEFEPAPPVLPGYTRQPFGITAPQPVLTDPVTFTVAGLAAIAYELVLQLLNRFFTHTDETDQQLTSLIGAAINMMAGVLRPLAAALTTLPAGPPHDGRTAGQLRRVLRAGQASGPAPSGRKGARHEPPHPRRTPGAARRGAHFLDRP